MKKSYLPNPDFFNTPFKRYGLACGLTALALGLHFLLLRWIGIGAPYILFFGVILLVPFLAGKRAGLLAVVLSTLLGAFFFAVRSEGNHQVIFRGLLFSAEGMSLVYLIDALKRAIDEQKIVQLQLHEALRARDDFLSIASHELKTPLTGLQLQIQLRQRDLERKGVELFTRERLASDLKTQFSYVHRISRLVDDILDATRASERKIHFQFSEFDFCEMVTEVIRRFNVAAEKSGVAIHLDACEAVHGHWDRFRIEQVVLNLLTNAVKYGKNKAVHVRIYSDSLNVVLSVRDEGMGIKPEDQERIFQRFERAISESEVSGLGLGLFIVKEIVTAHGGHIQLRSKAGEGSEFIVSLPKRVSAL